MTRSGPLFLVEAVILLSLEMLACGNTQRQLTSISLSPATADAKSYPLGQVQFVATGHYNKAPVSAPLQPALWSVVLQSAQQGNVTISASGVAECGAGTVGSFSVVAYSPADPSLPDTNASLLNGNKAAVGTAQIMCP